MRDFEHINSCLLLVMLRTYELGVLFTFSPTWLLLFQIPRKRPRSMCVFILCLLLPLRGSFVIVTFWVFVKTCYNNFRGVRNQNTWFLKIYVWICMCVRVCVRLDLSFYSVDFNRTGLIFFFLFFLCYFGSKICFLIGPMHFFFISNT